MDGRPVRDAYDTVAADYTRLLSDTSAEAPMDLGWSIPSLPLSRRP